MKALMTKVTVKEIMMTQASNNNSTNRTCDYSFDQFRKLIETDWELEPAAIDLLRRYFLRKWHTSNLLPLIKDGCLQFEGNNYQVRWIGGKHQATSQVMCSLSFRLTYGSHWPIVLVKMTRCESMPTWEELKNA